MVKGVAEFRLLFSVLQRKAFADDVGGSQPDEKTEPLHH